VTAPLITVVGSVNLDLVASAPSLPARGETVTGAVLARHPGGKGANQALAAQRLGAQVWMIGRVGADDMAREALALLIAEGVDVTGVRADPVLPTGVALIAVDPAAENQIVVASGANGGVAISDLPRRIQGALVCQLEIPLEVVGAALERADSLTVLNLAPAGPIPPALLAESGLLVVNDLEAAFYGAAIHAGGGLVAITHGARGASLYRSGDLLADAASPGVAAIDTTGAGDAFVAALTLAVLEGMPPEAALTFACAAGAVAATREGAQPSLPVRAEVDALLARS
jgi:ribokinase